MRILTKYGRQHPEERPAKKILPSTTISVSTELKGLARKRRKNAPKSCEGTQLQEGHERLQLPMQDGIVSDWIREWATRILRKKTSSHPDIVDINRKGTKSASLFPSPFKFISDLQEQECKPVFAHTPDISGAPSWTQSCRVSFSWLSSSWKSCSYWGYCHQGYVLCWFPLRLCVSFLLSSSDGSQIHEGLNCFISFSPTHFQNSSRGCLIHFCLEVVWLSLI